MPSNALKSLANTSHTVSVTLTAPVTMSVIGLAVLLAIAGGCWPDRSVAGGRPDCVTAADPLP